MTGRPPSSPTRPASCLSCDAAIFWALTVPGGKLIPVSAAPDPAGILAVRHEASGAWLARVLRTGQRPDPATEKTYTAHFADCPKAAEHRRKPPGRRSPPQPAPQPALFPAPRKDPQ